MILRDEIVEIGVYNKTHGIGGEISATLTCDTSVAGQFSCFISSIDGIYVPFFPESMRPKNQQTLLVKLEGIDTDVQARALANKAIYVSRKEHENLTRDLYGEDEYPLDYLVGFTVKEVSDGSTVGVIVDVDASTENVLFVVEAPDGGELLVPAADDFVAGIDEENKVIVMNLPDGLIGQQK